MKKPLWDVDRLLFGLVLATIIAAPTQYGFRIAGGINVSIVDPLLGLTAVLWGVWILVTKGLKQIVCPPVAALLLLVWAILTVFVAESLVDAVKDVVQYAEYFIAGMLVFAWFARDAHRRAVMTDTFLAAATGVVVLALAQYVSQSTPAFSVRGTFGNRNVLGGFLSMVVPLAFAGLLYGPGRGRRIWLGLLAGTGLLATLAGGSLIAMLVATGVVAMLHAPRTFLAYAVAVVLFLSVVAPRLPRANLEEAVASVAFFNDEAEPTARYPEWQAGVYMTLENPWLGIGIGNYQRNIGGYYGILPSDNQKSEADSQNLYLVLGSSLGLPGLLLFLGLLLQFGRTSLLAWRDATEPGERGLALGLLGAAIGFGVNAIWAPLLVRGIGLPLALLIALAWGQFRQKTEGGT